MPSVYFAAPLFTDAERAWNAAMVAELRRRLGGHEVLSPQEFCATFDGGPTTRPDFARIYRACVDHLERAAVVVAVIDGADADSGTSWEAGYACARGLPVIGLRTDWRPAEDGAGNCMLTRSCVVVARTIVEAAEAVSGALARR
jgi:nucleoside 2-deoxyribosyltransferase